MQRVLICQQNHCNRGVYVVTQGEFPSWWCYSGHQQLKLSYANSDEVDRTVPVNGHHWSEHPLLERSFEAISAFCSEVGFDSDELQEADWRPFDGNKEPSWLHREEPATWRSHRANYECFHVFIGGRAFFFWLRNDVDEVALDADAYFWEEEEGERRNGRIYLIKGGGAILNRMESTREADLTGYLASAYAILRGDPKANRVEVHWCTFNPMETYDGRKPLAVVTRDDVPDA